MEDKVEKGNKEIKDTMEQRGLKKKKKEFFPDSRFTKFSKYF